MYCKNCGSQIDDDARVCPYCGTVLADSQPYDGGQSGSYTSQSGGQYTESGTYQDPNSEQGQYQEGQAQYQPQGQPQQNYQYDPGYRQEQTGMDGYAIASLVLGIVSFFILPIVGAILAIVFGNMSMKNRGRNALARVGKILGIINIVLYIVVIVIVIIVAAVGVAMLF